MTYNEKLTKLASNYGVDSDTYFNMIKNEVVINGLILWAVIIIGIIVMIGGFTYIYQYCRKNEDTSEIDWLGTLMFFVVFFNVVMFIFTDFYTIPLNKTFNTDYEVVKKINDMDIE